MHILQPKRGFLWIEQLFRLGYFLVGVVSCLFFALGGDGPSHSEPRLASYDQTMNAIFALLWGGLSLAALFAYVRGSHGKVRVILTSRTLALKLGKKPTVFIKKSACSAYGPQERVYYLENGRKFRLHNLELAPWNISEIDAFMFSHWWSSETFDSLKQDFESKLPRPHRLMVAIGLIGLFIVVVLVVASAFFSTGQMTVLNIIAATCLISAASFVVSVLGYIVIMRVLERADYRFRLPQANEQADGAP